jgi:hypothetical protein
MRKTQNSRVTDTAIYRHKVIGDYFLYLERFYIPKAICTVLITEEQAHKTALLLGLEIQITVKPPKSDGI